MGLNMKLDTSGFKKVSEQARKNLPAAVFIEGTEIMADSQTNYAPVDTGHLRSTGHVDEPTRNGDGSYTVNLGYSATYAGVVHEMPPGWGQGKRKFLEKPLLVAARGFSQRVGTRAKRMMGW